MSLLAPAWKHLGSRTSGEVILYLEGKDAGHNPRYPTRSASSEEEAGTNQASRRNSDAGDPQKLRTREESGAEDAEFHVTEDI